VKISIIVPVRNVKDYLPRCLDSIINQTYANLEIIVVENRSTDGSKEICDEYAKKDPRLKVIHDDSCNRLADAWNVGLLAVTGELVGFVDSDDYIEAPMYELMQEAISEHQAQVAVCRYRYSYEGAPPSEHGLREQAGTGATYLFTRTEAIDLHVCEDEKIKILNPVWSKLFRREAIAGFFFANVKNGADLMFTTRAFCHSERIVYLDKVLYNYTVNRKDSVMGRKLASDFLDVDALLYKEQIAYLSAQGLNESAEKAAYSFYRRTLFWYIDFKKGKEKPLVKRLVNMLREEAPDIRAYYRHPWVKLGDKVRMRTFLFWPQLYYVLVKCYDRFIIPMRVKNKTAP
jgi:glycosyltransferase involved in cell wall biosynthesis